MVLNSEVQRSFFVYLKDPNTDIIQKIAFTCDVQVGSSVDNSMMLKLFGGLALNTTEFDTSINSVINVTKHSSFIDVKTSTSPLASTITINLPSDPVDGQTHFIKDTSGVALSTPFNIFPPSGLIDGAAFKSITTNYGSMIVHSMNGIWYVLSSGGAGGDITSQYVVIDYSTTLTNERKLTAGSGISITDSGPLNPVTVSSTLSSSSPGADVSASYLVLNSTSSLSNERVFIPGAGLSGSDAGSNSTYTVSINNSIVATISGSAFAQLSGSLQRLANGTSYLVAGQNVSIVTSSTGQVIISAPTGSLFPGASPLWIVPEVPHVDDVEFDSTTAPTGWLLRNLTDASTVTISGTINPYQAVTANDTVVAQYHTDWRRSFATWQGSTEGGNKYYTFAKAVTVPTNRVMWARMGLPTRFAGDTQDANMGIFFCTTSGSFATFLTDSVVFETGGPAANNPIRPGKLVAGVYTNINTGPSTIAGLGTVWEYMCIHKTSTTYNFWTFTDSGQRQHWGSTTHASTMTQVGFFFRSGASTSPGNAIYQTDFMRFIDSATQLPA